MLEVVCSFSSKMAAGQHTFIHSAQNDAEQSLNKKVMQIKPELIALNAGGRGGGGRWEGIRAGHLGG